MPFYFESCYHNIMIVVIFPHVPHYSMYRSYYLYATKHRTHNIYITDYGDFNVSRFNIILYIHGSVWRQSLNYTHTHLHLTHVQKWNMSRGLCRESGQDIFFMVARWKRMNKCNLLNMIFFIFLARHLKKLLWMSKIKNIVYFPSWPKEKKKTSSFLAKFRPKVSTSKHIVLHSHALVLLQTVVESS